MGFITKRLSWGIRHTARLQTARDGSRDPRRCQRSTVISVVKVLGAADHSAVKNGDIRPEAAEHALPVANGGHHSATRNGSSASKRPDGRSSRRGLGLNRSPGKPELLAGRRQGEVRPHACCMAERQGGAQRSRPSARTSSATCSAMPLYAGYVTSLRDQSRAIKGLHEAIIPRRRSTAYRRSAPTAPP